MDIKITPQINLPQSRSTQKATSTTPTVSEQPAYASYTAENVIASKGVSFKGSKPLNKLYDEYNWYIRYDKVSPIDAFLKIEESQEVLEKEDIGKLKQM